MWLPLEHSLLETWPATQARALIGTQTSNPLAHMLVLNPLSHTSKAEPKIFIIIDMGPQSLKEYN